MAHPLVEADPRWQDLQVERQRLAEAERKDRERRSCASAEFQEAQREHERAVAAAMLAGEEHPPAPQVVGVPGDPMVFIQARRQIDEAERAIVGSHADEIIEACAAEEAELLVLAAQQYRSLQETTARIGALIGEARSAHLASLPSGAAFSDSGARVDPMVVVDAATRGTSLVQQYARGSRGVDQTRDQRPMATIRTQAF